MVSIRLLILTSFHFLSVAPCSLPGRQSPLFRRFSFFFFCWISLGLVVLAWLGDQFYLKILENFISLILQDGFRFVPVLFVCMVEFKLLALFPNNHLSHPVVSSLIHFYANLLHSLIMWLCYFVVSFLFFFYLFLVVLFVLLLEKIQFLS